MGITSRRVRADKPHHVVVRLVWAIEDERGEVVDQGRLHHGLNGKTLADAEGHLKDLLARIEGV